MNNDSKKDWKKLARANGFSIPEQALDRIAAPLDGLEAAFRPLVRDLQAGDEPAVSFDACVEDAV